MHYQFSLLHSKILSQFTAMWLTHAAFLSSNKITYTNTKTTWTLLGLCYFSEQSPIVPCIIVTRNSKPQSACYNVTIKLGRKCDRKCGRLSLLGHTMITSLYHIIWNLPTHTILPASDYFESTKPSLENHQFRGAVIDCLSCTDVIRHYEW